MQQKREKLNLASTQSLTLSNYLILIKTLYYANPPACCAVTYKILNDRDYVARSTHKAYSLLYYVVIVKDITCGTAVQLLCRKLCCYDDI